jgi:hypothetical protein
MHGRVGLLVAVVSVAMLGGCASTGQVFEDHGIADTSTMTFPLENASYVASYTVRDWDPMTGCEFDLTLVRQPDEDPLAPGLPASSTHRVRVAPSGETTGSVAWATAQAGQYYLRVGGRCQWAISMRTG